MEGTSECMNEEREMGLRGWERVRKTPRACPCVSRVLVALEKRLLTVFAILSLLSMQLHALTTGDRTGEGEGERECLCDCERVCV
jgi:hypothetical protein